MKKSSIDFNKIQLQDLVPMLTEKIYADLVHYQCLDEKRSNLYIKIQIHKDFYVIIKFLNKSTDDSYLVYSKIYSKGSKKYFLSKSIFPNGDIYEQLSSYADSLAELLSDMIVSLSEVVSLNKIYIINNFDNGPNEKQFDEISFSDVHDVLEYVAYELDEDNDTILISFNLHLNPESKRYKVDASYKFFVNYTHIFGIDFYNIYFKSPVKEFNYYNVALTLEQALEFLRVALEHYSKLTHITVSPLETAEFKYYQLKEEERDV